MRDRQTTSDDHAFAVATDSATDAFQVAKANPPILTKGDLFRPGDVRNRYHRFHMLYKRLPAHRSASLRTMAHRFFAFSRNEPNSPRNPRPGKWFLYIESHRSCLATA